MINLKNLVRKNIWDLKPYASARNEYVGTEGTFLDANENPYGSLNRYPDPFQTELKSKLSKLKGIPASNIYIGNGSDEIIDLAFRIFCNPGADRALYFTPGYGMYNVAAAINQVEMLEEPLDTEFQINLNTVAKKISQSFLKLVFICSPNNPTGNLFKSGTIQYILNHFKGVVIIDEAYIDFSGTPSWIERLPEFNNLIICQTFSKSRSLASARLGMAFASAEIVALFNKIKLPYNVSSLNQKAAIQTLSKPDIYRLNIEKIINEKKRLMASLMQMPFIKKIFPSDANFFLVRVQHAQQLYNYLTGQKIIVRNRTQLVENCLRITVGSAFENNLLIKALKGYNQLKFF